MYSLLEEDICFLRNPSRKERAMKEQEEEQEKEEQDRKIQQNI